LLSSLQSSVSLPALFAPTADASKRFIEFFTANIRNPNTPQAYAWAVGKFATWCEANGLTELSDIEPVHVAAYYRNSMAAMMCPFRETLGGGKIGIGYWKGDINIRSVSLTF
jgi:hypothetical protein